MKDIFHNIYNGLLRFTPLRKNLRFSTQRGMFPRLGLLDVEKKHELEKCLGISINHVEYFEQALTHRSYLQVISEREIFSNERLEFLGDAVLSLVVADHLFSIHSGVDEGDLTKMRARLVNKNSLAIFAKKVDLESFIQMSYSAKKSVENGSDSIGADATESIIGAIYLDSGFEASRKFIINTLIPAVMDDEDSFLRNYKSKLLEYVQSLGKHAPTYSVTNESGPDHDKNFIVGVYVENVLVGNGQGKNKKQAEQDAARDAMENKNKFIN